MRRVRSVFLLLSLLLWGWQSLAQVVGDPIFDDSFEPLNLPPDPAEVAPAPEKGVPYDIGGGTEFLYTGPDPIQTGVDPETIDASRAAVIRGRLLDGAGNAVRGATVSILNHPELGQTRTRVDGRFDLAVNGGGLLTVVYEKDGWLPLQRRAAVPWRDFTVIPDAVIVPLNSRVDTVTLTSGAPAQVARGSVVADEDGSRQTTMVFPEGLGAQMVMPDESAEALTSMNVRATEYTVGEAGPQAMPAQLPAYSAYTYAVELSVDEALAAGASSVVFDEPVPVYLENYLGFSVGKAVPVGFYDHGLGRWIPSADGRVVRILDVSSGLAELDIDGSFDPASPAALTELGITLDERQQLALLYASGQELWRVPVNHFSTYDFNWPEEPPDDPPPNEPPQSPSGTGDGSNDAAEQLDDQICELPGSIVNCQNRSLGERLPVNGTPFTLNYSSDRMPGRLQGRRLDITLSNEVPEGLKEIALRVTVAGQSLEESFTPEPNLTYLFEWDGLDAYGRKVTGTVTASVEILYLYEQVYCEPDPSESPAFGAPCDSGSDVERPTARSRSGRRYNVKLNSWDGIGLGGWSLSAHHSYDAAGRVLHLGDGGRQSAPTLESGVGFVDVIGGGGDSTEDGIPATEATLAGDSSQSPLTGLAVAPDGEIYIALGPQRLVRRIDRQGLIWTVAGQLLQSGSEGDGGPAIDALLDRPNGLALSSDGELYIAQRNRIRKIDRDGIISTVAGGGDVTDYDGLPATQARISPQDIALGPDGTLYLRNGFRQVAAVRADGRIYNVVTSEGIYGNIAISPSGNLHYLDFSQNGAVQRIRGLARPERIFLPAPDDYGRDDYSLGSFTFGPDGSLIFLTADCIKKVRPVGAGTEVLVGTTTLMSGNPGTDHNCAAPGNDSPVKSGVALQATSPSGARMAVAPDGNIIIADDDDDADADRLRRIRSSFPGFGLEDFVIASSDQAQAFVFDQAGRHLRTVSTLTGATLFEFSYEDGLLSGVRDVNGNVTSIERDDQGDVTAILGPFGQRTTLSVDARGYLTSIANPAGETAQFQYRDDGMLTRITYPAGNFTDYQFDQSGELVQVLDDSGYQLNLARELLDRGYRVTRTTGEGVTTSHAVELTAERDVKLTNIDKAGGEYVITQGRDFSITTVRPTGMMSSMAYGADGPFGEQSPTSEVITRSSPGGLSLTVMSEKAVVLADPDDPLSLESISRTRTFDGRTTTSDYDAASRTTTTTTPTGRVQTHVLDAAGRVVQVDLAPDLDARTLSYDSFGRLERVQQGSEFLTYDYDTNGRLATRRNTAGHDFTYTYDAAGRPMTLTTPANRTFSYSYTPNGELSALTMPSGATHQLTYTSASELASYTAPGALALVETYDADRRRTGVTLPDGRAQTFNFDDSGRIARIDYPEAQVSFTYLGQTMLFDQLVRTPQPSGTGHVMAFTYDGELPLSVTMGDDSFTYAYDSVGRISAIQLNTEPALTFGYDDDDLVTQYGDFSITRTGPGGAPGTMTDGVLAVSYEFDALGRLTARRYAVNGALQYEFDLAYETGTGRISQRVESLSGQLTTYDYQYSLDGELTQGQQDAVVVESYTYDANGNRISADGTAATYDAQDRLLSAGGIDYAHDPSGVMVSRGNDLFDYSTRGELLQVTLNGATDVIYGHDALGRMVSRTDAAGTTVMLYGFPTNPFLMMASRLPDGTLTRYFYDEADTLLAFERGSERFHVAADQVGSPRLVWDSAGVVVKTVDYDSYGRVLSDSNPDLELLIGFAGGLADPATGLVRFGFRDYDTWSGRWTSRDPILMQSGQPNLYLYANSDPVGRRDPTGLECLNIGVDAIASVFGFGAGVKVCYENGKVAACAEVGLKARFPPGAASKAPSIGHSGGGVSVGDADYVQVEAGFKCPVVDGKVGAKLNDCGDLTLNSTIGLSGFDPTTGRAGRLGADYGINLTTMEGTLGTGFSSSAGFKPNDDYATPPQPNVDKAECGLSAGVKGGVCFGSTR